MSSIFLVHMHITHIKPDADTTFTCSNYVS